MTSPKPPLTSFSALSFDCYGTLIDWQLGISTALTPLRSQLPPSHPLLSTPFALVSAFSAHEEPLCLTRPGVPYPALLSEAYTNLCSKLQLPAPSEKELAEFSGSVGAWPAFPDTVAALQTLKRRGYKLVVLSNVDNASFAATNAGPLGGVKFDAVYTAEDIGTYKPDRRNFDYLLNGVVEEFGVGKDKLLHVGVGLKADHVPAKEIGLQSCWISRRGDAKVLEEVEGKVAFQWRFESMGDFVGAVEKETQGT